MRRKRPLHVPPSKRTRQEESTDEEEEASPPVTPPFVAGDYGSAAVATEAIATTEAAAPTAATEEEDTAEILRQHILQYVGQILADDDGRTGGEEEVEYAVWDDLLTGMQDTPPIQEGEKETGEERERKRRKRKSKEEKGGNGRTVRQKDALEGVRSPAHSPLWSDDGAEVETKAGEEKEKAEQDTPVRKRKKERGNENETKRRKRKREEERGGKRRQVRQKDAFDGVGSPGLSPLWSDDGAEVGRKAGEEEEKAEEHIPVQGRGKKTGNKKETKRRKEKRQEKRGGHGRQVRREDSFGSSESPDLSPLWSDDASEVGLYAGEEEEISEEDTSFADSGDEGPSTGPSFALLTRLQRRGGRRRTEREFIGRAVGSFRFDPSQPSKGLVLVNQRGRGWTRQEALPEVEGEPFSPLSPLYAAGDHDGADVTTEESSTTETASPTATTEEEDAVEELHQHMVLYVGDLLAEDEGSIATEELDYAGWLALLTDMQDMQSIGEREEEAGNEETKRRKRRRKEERGGKERQVRQIDSTENDWLPFLSPFLSDDESEVGTRAGEEKEKSEEDTRVTDSGDEGPSTGLSAAQRKRVQRRRRRRRREGSFLASVAAAFPFDPRYQPQGTVLVNPIGCPSDEEEEQQQQQEKEQQLQQEKEEREEGMEERTRRHTSRQLEYTVRVPHIGASYVVGSKEITDESVRIYDSFCYFMDFAAGFVIINRNKEVM
ncbi:LOW QUALITY PROTEIN: uncharacterized protein EMH_0065750 [Eimeria mitis]|uniref:Uncharacterized protein n=1 Tax=Eimeria mitis TaxID=44415 RepID=U6KIP6_9EIME|nr:LOW QUALITY PROTEIN: uncharacterized protein EMH_0065750 [Eimeria mitis]CDJ36142.1 hypothetical protein EMH_0065750 [Eimeria mitis]